MSKALVKASQNTLGNFTQEQIELIKNTVAKGATDSELQLFLAVANRSGLDVFSHQIHCVKRRAWNKETKKYDEVCSIQCGIDGYRAVAARTGEHAGTDAAIIEEKDNLPIKATTTVYRMIQGQRVPFTATARFSEYAQTYDGKLTGQWAKMPFLMLEKCSEALALRKGFANVLSGIYTNEEMNQADNVVVKTKEVVAEVVPTEEKTNTNTAKNRIVLLMKAAGLQPTENTQQAWEAAVKKAVGMELDEENFEAIIAALEATNVKPE